MIKKTILCFLVSFLIIFTACISIAEDDPINFSVLFSNMTKEELQLLDETLHQILNEKIIGDAVLIIDPVQSEISKGKTQKLSVSSDGRVINQKTKIKYTSSDDSVATVGTTGIVTGKGPGTATITINAEFEDGGVLEAKADIRVIVPVTSVKGPQTASSVFAGDSLDVGSLFSVVPDNATEQGLLFQVSDDSIASIDADGILKAKKAGSVTVTATSAENATYPKSFKLKVVVNQAVKTIKLDKTEFTVGKGKTFKLSATVGPKDATNQKVIWTSSNPKIATVNTTGTVTGVSGGSATITCTAADGSEIYATAKATVITAISSIRLTPKEVTIFVGKSASVSSTILPNDASNKTLKWTSSNSRAKVDKGKITGINSGECTITASATDGSNASATIKVYVEPLLPLVVESIHWQTTWGMKNGKFGVIAQSKCTHATIKSFDYTVKCYNRYDSNPVISYMTYSGPAIRAGSSGKSSLSSQSVSGFSSAYYVEVIPTTVYFQDGTSYTIPSDSRYTSTFDLR